MKERNGKKRKETRRKRLIRKTKRMTSFGKRRHPVPPRTKPNKCRTGLTIGVSITCHGHSINPQIVDWTWHIRNTNLLDLVKFRRLRLSLQLSHLLTLIRLLQDLPWSASLTSFRQSPTKSDSLRQHGFTCGTFSSLLQLIATPWPDPTLIPT